MSLWLLLLYLPLFCLALYLFGAFLEGKWKLSFRRKSAASSVGTALLELNTLARPSMYHAIEAIHARPLLREEEGNGDGDPHVMTVRLPAAEPTKFS